MSQSRYAGLSRSEAGAVLPELLLIKPADRPIRHGLVYQHSAARRCCDRHRGGRAPARSTPCAPKARAEGDDAWHHLQGLQLDIGAPPQFMDFRFYPARPLARRVSPRPLRCAAATWIRATTASSAVPHHRRSGVRRHHDRDQPRAQVRPSTSHRPRKPVDRTVRGRHHRQSLSRVVFRRWTRSVKQSTELEQRRASDDGL